MLFIIPYIDDFYEAAELYISTQDTTTLDENGEIDAFSASTNDVAWVQETTMKLQLLRGWKKFNSNPNDIELLLMGMEEVLGMVRGFQKLMLYAIRNAIKNLSHLFCAW